MCWQTLFFLSLPLLILSSYFQPAFEYNTEEPCAVNTDTHPWVYLHIHTFISFWNKQDQRRKVGQTPLRCRAWLCVALNTDGPTQDKCCLLLMEGPSATLCTLYLKTPRESQPKATGERKPECIYCMCACIWKIALLCQRVKLECISLVQSQSPLFFCNFRIVCCLLSRSSLQCSRMEKPSCST